SGSRRREPPHRGAVQGRLRAATRAEDALRAAARTEDTLRAATRAEDRLRAATPVEDRLRATTRTKDLVPAGARTDQRPGSGPLAGVVSRRPRRPAAAGRLDHDIYAKAQDCAHFQPEGQ